MASSCTTATDASTSCPSLPPVEVDDENLVGPVDDMNVFVAEHLLDVSDNFQIFDFFLRFQVIEREGERGGREGGREGGRDRKRERGNVLVFKQCSLK